ncbi:MAG TPA: hypothetical protein VKP30_00835, partial [Polyangiaceae bacterium]|nr:hypothetical protein [Polyangiaceae bacterium]
MSSRIRWVIGVTSIGLSISAPAVAADVPGLAYRPAIGCPAREVFAEELLRRMLFRAPRSDKSLRVSIEYVDSAYVGSVALADAEFTAARQVRNESCEQVVQALALMGALLLEDEQHAAVEQSPALIQEQPATRASTAAAKTEQSTIVTPPSIQPSKPISRERPIKSFTLGPWVALLSDGLVTPEFVRFGGRFGA